MSRFQPGFVSICAIMARENDTVRAGARDAATTRPMEAGCVAPGEGEPVAGGDEAALVEAARTQPQAFAALYQRYLTRIYRYLRTRANSEEDAADLTQQVFLNALDALPTYHERGLPFAAWLFRIARNVATDYHRRRRPTVTWDLVPETLQATGDGGPEAALLQQEALTRLRSMLARLDPDKRELLALRFAAGLTAPELAAVVGKSEAAVRKQLARTLHALKERYHDL